VGIYTSRLHTSEPLYLHASIPPRIHTSVPTSWISTPHASIPPRLYTSMPPSLHTSLPTCLHLYIHASTPPWARICLYTSVPTSWAYTPAQVHFSVPHTYTWVARIGGRSYIDTLYSAIVFSYHINRICPFCNTLDVYFLSTSCPSSTFC